MTENVISSSYAAVGQPKKNYEQTPARFGEGVLAKMDSRLGAGYKRADFIREAVDREIKRRQRGKS